TEAISAIDRVMRAPQMMRDRRSRPILSVPSHAVEEGGAQTAPTTADTGCGARSGANTAISTKNARPDRPIIAPSGGSFRFALCGAGRALAVLLIADASNADWSI